MAYNTGLDIPLHMSKRTTYRSLEAWRKAQKLTQAEAAERLGMTQGAYSRIANRIRFPRGPVAKRIHEQTGVPVAVLVGAA